MLKSCMAAVLIGVVCLDSQAALSIEPGAWSVSCVGSRSFGLIVGLFCRLCSSAVPGVLSFLRVTQRHCGQDLPRAPSEQGRGQFAHGVVWCKLGFAFLVACRVDVLVGVTQRKLQTPGNAEEYKRQDHLQSTQSAQPTNPTDQAQSTTERTARETHNTK